jgi:hypothetical protein
MANDLACKNVARDFVAQQSQRTLFPMVEATYVPEDGNGFDVPMAIEAIRRNIQYLHRHVLGESLELDDPEIDRTYDLFYETWKEGRAKVLARDLPASIHYSCQGRVDFWTGEAFPVAERVAADGLYAVRAWSAVVSYLLMDYRFLYD